MSQISPLPDASESKAISRLSGDHAGWNGRRDCAASSRNPVPSAFPVHRFQWPERLETNAIDFPSGENRRIHLLANGGEQFFGSRRVLLANPVQRQAPDVGIEILQHVRQPGAVRARSRSGRMRLLKRKAQASRRPSMVTCLSSPVLIAPPPYTMVRLSGFHANVVIGTGLVTSSFGFPPGCGTTQSSYVAPFSQRR